ncbi:hypothetical protein MKY14_16385 [Paenibacillus sp. FSL R5-0887]|uniref:hypothetical protein n=1 Tax=Paenibacillus sp. FSL R5-0887 TaxID=2921662 RepID=UPI0030F821C6
MKISASQTVVIYFVGGGTTTITGDNARTIASNLQRNEWLDLGDKFIQSKNVAYYTVDGAPEYDPPNVDGGF